MDIVWIVTRVLSGDNQTDKEMEDDVIDIGQFDSEADDEDEGSLEPLELTAPETVSEADLPEKYEIIAQMKKETIAKYGIEAVS